MNVERLFPITSLEQIRELSAVSRDIIAEGTLKKRDLAMRAAAYLISEKGREELRSLCRSSKIYLEKSLRTANL